MNPLAERIAFAEFFGQHFVDDGDRRSADWVASLAVKERPRNKGKPTAAK